MAGKRGSLQPRCCIDEMEEYIPISTPEALAEKLGLRLDQILKLDGNENPYGCSPRVPRALAEFASYHRYPDPMQTEARAMLAGYVGVPADNLMLGTGSDELIDDLLRVYLEPGDEVIECPPTFGMYSFSTQICAGRIVRVPRGERFQVDLEGVERAITPRTKMIFVDSPNNPSGLVTSREQVERLLATGMLVVVDEAYAEFASFTATHMVLDHPNLVVLRTFSKWAGLAGLRVGYGVFPEGVIRQLWKMKQPYNLNLAAQVAVQESLRDVDFLMSNVRKIVDERQRLYATLSTVDFLRVYPSEANFLLCDLLQGDAVELVAFLARRGIIIRYFKKPRVSNSIRISIGSPEQNDAVVAALREWRGR
jgi:histidinol-phosphate aminotransferase